MSAERDTLAAMISLFCKAHHQGEPPCASCRDLLRYAEERLGKCTYGAQKPTCRKCPIHCYRPEMRERITAVMKYAGPRMLIHHPVAALRHLLQERAADAPRTGDKQGRT